MELKKINKLKSFLAELDIQGIAYVSWKNNHQLHSVMLGNGDIDLFVPFEKRSKFISVCKSLGWIEFESPISKHSHISHYYALGQNCEVFHIHVYFKLITGETWIKEYSIPFDNWLITNRIWDNNNEIWILNNASQAYFFLVRHMLKCGSIISRILYKRELFSYEEEWKRCSQGLSKEDIKGPIDISSYFATSGAFDQKLQLPKISSAVFFRFSIYRFLKYSILSLPFRRLQSFMKRLANKVFFKQKKVLPNKGLIVAISGVDGSGKTTMLQEIHTVFGQFLTINRFHLGRPQGKLIELIWRALGNKSENSSMPGCLNITTPSSKFKAINGVILAFLRYRKAKQIVKQTNTGGLMLVDRWPTDEIGKMDGPRVIIGENSGWIQHLCKYLETSFYANMPQADICYFFVVPIEVAIERNRLRLKENKETEYQIIKRFNGNLDYKPIAKQCVLFKNEGEFSVKRKELLSNVWHEIFNRQ